MITKSPYTEIRPLAAMPYAQARIKKNVFGGYYLVSYETTVLHLSHNGWLHVFGLYSATTRRHISAFMKEMTSLDYQTAKRCYENGWDINVNTGEIRAVR